ncbi:omega-hydroxypalmitate O-feruloyl transferase [Juglans microcarpa x Juglans regia]|uniref:omega-hydroxypalmitate O-feruloyl transferase n=1 Tax=Juglans microcarpa x Juglans regia TaxID=2249226 RepID=UPI001B7E96A6|nr:omega-hydroxypalmitate O-feruloyl transferase [Juglans microcarpa x Juglans regia]
MGTLYQEPSSLLQDLKVTVHSSSLVFPSQESVRKSMFLSNIDQVLNFSVETVHFFPSKKDFPPEVVAEKLKHTLAKALVPYDFLAGRLNRNPKTGRLEIDCNAAGVGFVVASSEYTLDEIGDLVYPNPAFAQLVCKTLGYILKPDDQPLGIFQLTSFKCGGFAMGISTNHATFDGLSFKHFLDNLASLAADKPCLAVIPCNDRQLLAARSPPQVPFSHPELLKIPHGQESNLSVFEATQEDLAFNIFRLTSGDIANLKEQAKATSGAAINANTRITGFNVVAAHVWRCKALSCGADNNMERLSTILYAVDIRPRLKPPLPSSYAGNAVLTSYATAPCKELAEGTLAKLVEMVSEGARRMTDEYARSAIDWGELYKGFPHGEFLVSSWWRLGFAEVEYPWGRPRYSCPIVYHRKDIILLFPDINEGGDERDSGVNVLVALPAEEMKKFQSLFLKLLAA